MIVSFADEGTEDIYNGRDTTAARKQCPSQIWGVARRKLDAIQAAVELGDLRAPPGNELKPLARDRKGQHGIRINDQYRVCFRWTPKGAEGVEVTDYH
jgi:proteic killer suppression protein